MIKMSFNRCKDIHKFGNKYLPSAYKTEVEFRSHFSGKNSASYGPRNTVINFRGSFTFALPWMLVGITADGNMGHLEVIYRVFI